MSRQVESMKTEIGRNRKAHCARLKTLSAAAAVVKTRLATALTTGEKLFAAAEAARVHESLAEKIDPFALARGVGGGARRAWGPPLARPARRSWLPPASRRPAAAQAWRKRAAAAQRQRKPWQPAWASQWTF